MNRLANLLIFIGTGIVSGVFAWVLIARSVIAPAFGNARWFIFVPFWCVGIGASTVAIGVYVRLLPRKKWPSKQSGFEVKLNLGTTPGLIEKKED